MASGLKTLAKPGAAAAVTVKVALAAGAVAMEEVRSLVVFTRLPAPKARTSTLIEQSVPAAMSPLLKSSRFPPVLTLSVPPQVLDGFDGSAMTSPSGKVSLKVASAISIRLPVLSMSMVRVETSPCAILAGAKDLAKPGASARVTSMPALAPSAVTRSEVRSPDSLKMSLALSTRTVVEIVQVSPAARVPFASVRDVPSVARLAVPPQVLLTVLDVVISPSGKLSVKARLPAAMALALLSMV
mmetsp:Transcript_28767/g.54569  ORF Transcript_28767/g.54569 Transcript_28767/m.54569 type:complete len:242 (+) Transcript_28767:949-1674(+)